MSGRDAGDRVGAVSRIFIERSLGKPDNRIGDCAVVFATAVATIPGQEDGAAVASTRAVSSTRDATRALREGCS